MLYKSLFFFSSYLEKKYSLFRCGDHYIPSYIIVGFTIAVNLFVTADVVCILFLQSRVVADIIIYSMYLVGFAMIVISYLFFRQNNRRDTIFEEVSKLPASKKIKYGVCCFLYIVFSYGLWFVCNDIMCVKTRPRVDLCGKNCTCIKSKVLGISVEGKV